MAEKHTLRNIALLGLVIYGVRQYKLYQGLQFGVAGISFAGSLSNPQLRVRVALNNPTGVSATLNSLTGSVYSDGTYVAHVSYNTSEVIEPYNRTLITLNVNPDVSGVLQTIANYLITTNKTAVFTFNGNAVVDNIPLPVSMDYRFGGQTS